MSFCTVLEWVTEWQFWMAVASLIGGIFAIWKYFNGKKQQEFENYHRLIERINRPLSGDGSTFLQVQQAAIFELRYYRRYKKLTVKLLRQLLSLEEWRSNEKLRTSINDTLNYFGETPIG